MMNRFKELRKQNHFTLQDLSDALRTQQRINISPDSLAKYERVERKPKIDKLEALADFYGVTVSYLLGLEDKTENKEKHKANIFIWVHNDELTERRQVTDFEIDDNVVIADEDGEKWIYPLTSIMGIEVLNKK